MAERERDLGQLVLDLVDRLAGRHHRRAKVHEQRPDLLRRLLVHGHTLSPAELSDRSA
ncbi:hypothetical protein GCM10022197_05830 [Microlunatus spumicola]|uniref:MarR family transcriptional regulator n=1 Tax=Microlunatus spumicola TaxID=81499 RepID=A0ABP6WT08_9ACTN